MKRNNNQIQSRTNFIPAKRHSSKYSPLTFIQFSYWTINCRTNFEIIYPVFRTFIDSLLKCVWPLKIWNGLPVASQELIVVHFSRLSILLKCQVKNWIFINNCFDVLFGFYLKWRYSAKNPKNKIKLQFHNDLFLAVWWYRMSFWFFSIRWYLCLLKLSKWCSISPYRVWFV